MIVPDPSAGSLYPKPTRLGAERGMGCVRISHAGLHCVQGATTMAALGPYVFDGQACADRSEHIDDRHVDY